MSCLHLPLLPNRLISQPSSLLSAAMQPFHLVLHLLVLPCTSRTLVLSLSPPLLMLCLYHLSLAPCLPFESWSPVIVPLVHELLNLTKNLPILRAFFSTHQGKEREGEALHRRATVKVWRERWEQGTLPRHPGPRLQREEGQEALWPRWRLRVLLRCVLCLPQVSFLYRHSITWDLQCTFF